MGALILLMRMVVLSCARQEIQKSTIDPFDFQFYNNGLYSMINWVYKVESLGNPPLDVVGDPLRPSCFIFEAVKQDQ